MPLSSLLLVAVAALAGCRSSPSEGSAAKPDASTAPVREPPDRDAGLTRPAPVVRLPLAPVEGTTDDVALPFATAVPPSRGIVRPFKAPRLRVETGRCYVRLLRLDHWEVDETRTAFLVRNPDWEMSETDVNPFTGLVERARRPRRTEQIGPPSALTDDEYERRRLEPVRRNADLMGMKPNEIRRLQWTARSFRASLQNLGGSTAHGRLAVSPERYRQVSDAEMGWNVLVDFQRDGVVYGFHVMQFPLPVDVCTTATFSPHSARLSAGAVGDFGGLGPKSVSEPELRIESYTDNGLSDRVAPSRTWRLLWRVALPNTIVFIDATTGERVFERPAFIE